MVKDDEEAKSIMDEFCKIIGESEGLSPSNIQALMSLVHDFELRRVGESEFNKSLELLFAKDEDKDKSLEKGEVNLCDPNIRADIEIRASCQKIEIRAKVEETTKEDVCYDLGFEKYVDRIDDMEGKKRRILLRDHQMERSPKRTRTSRKIVERVTPSYRLIRPKEEQCPVSETVLNNKCLLRKVDGSTWGCSKRVTDEEKAMAKREDDMYEADMLMETLKGVIGNVEKVRKGEMRWEDVGVKFYRCIEMLYGGKGMVRVVKENHLKALPVVLCRLKQKLHELTVARNSLKHVFEEKSSRKRGSRKKKASRRS